MDIMAQSKDGRAHIIKNKLITLDNIAFQEIYVYLRDMELLDPSVLETMLLKFSAISKLASDQVISQFRDIPQDKM